MPRYNLLPNLGDQRLDAITEADVARMKARYAYQAPASVNNILTLLGTMLKTAIEWGVIVAMRHAAAPVEGSGRPRSPE